MMKDGSKSTSSHVISEITASALVEIEPPVEAGLDDEHMPYWRDIIQTRHEWTKVDLRHAANLARNWYDIDQLNMAIKENGYTVWGGKNGTTKVANPELTARESLIRQSVTLSAKLQVHAQATMGESREQKSRNNKKREAVQAFDALDDDDLIARPN